MTVFSFGIPVGAAFGASLGFRVQVLGILESIVCIALGLLALPCLTARSRGCGALGFHNGS